MDPLYASCTVASAHCFDLGCHDEQFEVFFCGGSV